MATEILVRGEGEARALPDRAILRVSIEGEGSSQDDAYKKAAREARDVDAVLERYSAAIERKTTTRLVVLPKTRWKKGESIKTGWIASRTTTVEAVDLSQLGAMIADLANAGAASIQGPTWELDSRNQVHEKARHAAVLDARKRAEAYVAALGLKVQRIAWLSEPGLRIGRESGEMSLGGGRVMALSRGAAGAEPIEVSPEEITVRAVVEMAVEAEPAS